MLVNDRIVCTGTPITLFAPTDDVFRTLSPKASITGNLHSLKEFHHVTVQAAYSRGLIASGEMNLVRGGNIKIAVSESKSSYKIVFLLYDFQRYIVSESTPFHLGSPHFLSDIMSFRNRIKILLKKIK